MSLTTHATLFEGRDDDCWYDLHVEISGGENEGVYEQMNHHTNQTRTIESTMKHREERRYKFVEHTQE